MTDVIGPTVNIVFTWQTFMPDHRPYKQNSIVLTPQDTQVIVRVPVESKYITNAEAILVNDLYATPIRPLFTPLGMRFAMDQLESVLPDVPLNSVDFNPDTEDEFKTAFETGEDDEFEIVEDDEEEDEWKLVK